MTSDDEAFIRAIVAAPGDDAPRLVYADWLEERGDPRGTYLRAEIEWAWQWSKGMPPRATLPAGRIDPFWVFRVSRPPTGVCCDHLKLSERGPSIGREDLESLERRQGFTLPVDYQAFLINSNGGVPEPSCYYPKRSRQPNPSITRLFYSVGGAAVVPRAAAHRQALLHRDLEHQTETLHESAAVGRLRKSSPRTGDREFVPVASDSQLGHLAIGLSGRRTGKLYHINRERLGTSCPPRMVAASLSEFLSMLRFTFDAENESFGI